MMEMYYKQGILKSLESLSGKEGENPGNSEPGRGNGSSPANENKTKNQTKPKHIYR